jgi:hypothetical protein
MDNTVPFFEEAYCLIGKKACKQNKEQKYCYKYQKRDSFKKSTEKTILTLAGRG